MSDTVKLIIEIPKKEYEAFKELIAINMGGRCSGKGIIQTCLNAVKNGTPLDDVKAEIKTFTITEKSEYDIGFNDAVLKCFNIFDNIGKAESEDKE